MDRDIQKRRSALTLRLLWGAALIAAFGCREQNAEFSNPPSAPADTSFCTPFANLYAAGDAVTLGGQLFSGKACTRYPNGNLHTVTGYRAGRKEGPWQVYYPDGVLMKEGLIADGQDEGDYNEYFPDGTQKYAYRYRKGLKTGKWKSWYKDGTPYTERNFRDDKLHGKVLVWDESGTLAKEYDYRSGKLVFSKMHFAE